MTVGESNAPDLHSHALCAVLQSAAEALRAGLNQPFTEPLIRAHIERALTHIRESETALHNLAHARTVKQLAEHLARIDEMREELRSQEINNTTSSIRI